MQATAAGLVVVGDWWHDFWNARFWERASGRKQAALGIAFSRTTDPAVFSGFLVQWTIAAGAATI